MNKNNSGNNVIQIKINTKDLVQLNYIKKEETSQIEKNEAIEIKEDIKTNNFMNKPGSKGSKKNVHSAGNSKTESALNELQQIITNANKYVDDLGVKVSNSNDIKKKESKDDDYDYFNIDNDRISILKPSEDGQSRANNIFKRNLTENEETVIPLNEKFSNIKIDTERDKQKVLHLDEIQEDFNEVIESHASTQIRKNLEKIDITQQTGNFEVSDTLVNKDKNFMNNVNNLLVSNNPQSQFLQTDTFYHEDLTTIQASHNQSNFTESNTITDQINVNNPILIPTYIQNNNNVIINPNNNTTGTDNSGTTDQNISLKKKKKKKNRNFKNLENENCMKHNYIVNNDTNNYYINKLVENRIEKVNDVKELEKTIK